jgi:hypothetical protein
MNIKTPFQKEFKINDEFYSGTQIREAIKKYFPLNKNTYEGLAGITSNCKTQNPKNEKDLKEAIPDHPVEIDEFNPKYHKFFPYIIQELGNIDIAVTVFHPTDLGYICDEQGRE